MTDKFKDYLLGSKVTVVTDNNPLCYILKNAKLDATSHRWLAALSIFDFELRYKKGSLHLDADGLSRRPQDTPHEDPEYRKMLEQAEFLKGKAREFDGEHNSEQMDREAVSAVMHSKGVDEGSTAFPGAEILYPAIEQVVIDPSGVQDDILDPPIAVCHSISQQEWRQLQLVDKTLSTAIKLLEDGSKLEECQDTLLKGTPEYMGLVQEQKRLVLQEGVLYRKVEAEAGEVVYQLVVPASHRQAALKGVHEELFHPHYEISLRHARKCFYWPYMARELAVKLKRCERCVRRGSRIQKAPMKTIETTFPLELLSVDFLTIEVKGVKQDILVILDHFTKLGQAIMTRDQTAKSVARALWNDFFMIYGFPKHILTDQGRD